MLFLGTRHISLFNNADFFYVSPGSPFIPRYRQCFFSGEVEKQSSALERYHRSPQVSGSLASIIAFSCNSKQTVMSRQRDCCCCLSAAPVSCLAESSLGRLQRRRSQTQTAILLLPGPGRAVPGLQHLPVSLRNHLGQWELKQGCTFICHESNTYTCVHERHFHV